MRLFCKLNETNWGLECNTPWPEYCAKCGWNPEVAEKRIEEFIKNYSNGGDTDVRSKSD